MDVGKPTDTSAKLLRSDTMDVGKEEDEFCWLKERPDILDFPVVDQDTLPICSSVAALTACEVLYRLEYPDDAPENLSYQNLINEVPNKYRTKCNEPTEVTEMGCWNFRAETAFEYVKTHGVCRQENLPFYCRRNRKKPSLNCTRFKIRDYESFEKGEQSEDYIKTIILESPIVGEMAFYTHFHKYQGGILRDPEVFAQPIEAECLHAVLITGYGEEGGVKYYKIRNSHSKEWGDEGYGKVERSLFERFARPIGTYLEHP